MITGINHITVSVKNLYESFEFYANVLGFKPLMKHPQGAYFLAGDLWFCLDLDPQTRSSPLPEYTHFAFSVDEADFSNLSEKIIASGVKIWKDNKSEGNSLYFLDPNGHKLEIHVGGWKTRITHYKNDPKYSCMTFFNE